MQRAIVAFLCVCVGPWASAQDTPTALTGARILTAAGEPIENGVLLVHEGKIQALGSSASMTLPRDIRHVDVSGKVIIPGLVDTHSHVGIGGRPSVPANADVNERTDPVTPQLRALDAI